MNSYLFDFFYCNEKGKITTIVRKKFTEFIDNLVNLKYNPSMNLSQRGKETWKRGNNGERGLDLFSQRSALPLD
ncbi:hypothetical protein BC2926_03800 [Bacillus cereus]|nr:hypothetical protein BC2926_03800 [Bacillus cereus]